MFPEDVYGFMEKLYARIRELAEEKFSGHLVLTFFDGAIVEIKETREGEYTPPDLEDLSLN